jgi:hypothetical protein
MSRIGDGCDFTGAGLSVDFDGWEFGIGWVMRYSLT